MKIPGLILILAAAVSLTVWRRVGKEKKPAIEPPAVSELARDILHITHREYGNEKFPITDARCNLRKHDDGVWEFTVGIECGEGIQRIPEFAEVVNPEPHLETTAILPPGDLELKPGRVLIQKEGYDRVRDQHLSNWYYFSHRNVEDVRIELLEVTDEWIEARVTGITGVEAGDGTAQVMFLTRFKRDKDFKRGIQ